MDGVLDVVNVATDIAATVDNDAAAVVDVADVAAVVDDVAASVVDVATIADVASSDANVVSTIADVAATAANVAAAVSISLSEIEEQVLIKQRLNIFLSFWFVPKNMFKIKATPAMMSQLASETFFYAFGCTYKKVDPLTDASFLVNITPSRGVVINMS